MTDEEVKAARGRAIGDRIGKRSDGKIPLAQVHRDAGVSRQTVYAAIKGEAEEASYDAIEAALERIDDDQSQNAEDYAVSDEGEVAEVELHGVFGVERVIVRGRPGNIEAEVRATLQALREGMSTPPPPRRD